MESKCTGKGMDGGSYDRVLNVLKLMGDILNFVVIFLFIDQLSLFFTLVLLDLTYFIMFVTDE